MYLKKIALAGLLTISIQSVFADDSHKRHSSGGGSPIEFQALMDARSAPLREIGMREAEIARFRQVVDRTQVVVVSMPEKIEFTSPRPPSFQEPRVADLHDLRKILNESILPMFSEGKQRIYIREDSSHRMKQLLENREFQGVLRSFDLNPVNLDASDLMVAATIRAYSKLMGNRSESVFFDVLRYRAQKKVPASGSGGGDSRDANSARP